MLNDEERKRRLRALNNHVGDVLADGESIQVPLLLRDSAGPSGRTVTHLADGSAKVAFADGTSAIIRPGQHTYFDQAGNLAQSLSHEQALFMAGGEAAKVFDAMVASEAAYRASVASINDWRKSA